VFVVIKSYFYDFCLQIILKCSLRPVIHFPRTRDLCRLQISLSLDLDQGVGVPTNKNKVQLCVVHKLKIRPMVVIKTLATLHGVRQGLNKAKWGRSHLHFVALVFRIHLHVWVWAQCGQLTWL
jgi:hypothetical protein